MNQSLVGRRGTAAPPHQHWILFNPRSLEAQGQGRQPIISMWRRVNNLVNSLKTYQTLSPDVRFRQYVNQRLQERQSLSLDEWFEAFWETENILKVTAEFAYYTVASYSGLKFAYVLPEDRLEEDLCWTHVCWFDWELVFFDDVNAQFDIDISDRFCWEKMYTVADLLTFLDQQIRPYAESKQNSSNSI